MSVKIVNFNAKDGIKLDGILNKCEKQTNKILIQIHGMTSNCFKKRDKTIAEEIEKIEIDTLCFNNRGSEIVRYIKGENVTLIGGMAYEKVEDSYYDIVGAIEFVISLGYDEIYLQGHSLGSTKVVYTYNKLTEEESPLLEKIKGIMLLSLIDIKDAVSIGIKEEYIRYAEQKKQEGKIMELMPFESFIHPISVKSFLYYTKNNQNIDFARYNDREYEFEKLNKIICPLFMRWGNVREMIKQNAKELVEFMNSKINNPKKDIGYIDGADHSYHGKEEQIAREIKDFLRRY